MSNSRPEAGSPRNSCGKALPARRIVKAPRIKKYGRTRPDFSVNSPKRSALRAKQRMNRLVFGRVGLSRRDQAAIAGGAHNTHQWKTIVSAAQAAPHVTIESSARCARRVSA